MLNNKLNILDKLHVSDWAIKLLYLLLATDIAFIVFHFVYSYSDLTSNNSFSLATERGYSDVFQYAKLYWTSLLLGFMAVRTRSIVFLSWSLLFFYLLLDDIAQIHETLGLLISNKFGFSDSFNLRARDFGEIAISALVGCFFLSFVAINYASSDRISRTASKYLMLLLVILALFGIGIDMLHIALKAMIKSPLLDPILIFFEDGGELLMMSIITCFVFLLSKQANKKHS